MHLSSPSICSECNAKTTVTLCIYARRGGGILRKLVEAGVYIDVSVTEYYATITFAEEII